MKKLFVRLPFLLLLLLATGTLSAKTIDYAVLPAAKAFVNRMHETYGFDRKRLYSLLHRAKHQAKTLARYQGRHKVGSTDFSWERYKSKILVVESIRLGREFMSKYRGWLRKASRKYRISPEIITAFIRVESKFGLYGREYPVWDSLVTLAFNPNRKQRFFRNELEQLLILARENRLNVLELRGSFAGAMGCVQQVPSIQRRYGTDLDGDGRKDPDSMADCIGSIAAFLHRNGWDDRRPTVRKARYPGKRFRGLKTGYTRRYSLQTLRAHGIVSPGRWPYRDAYLIRLRGKRSDEIYLGDRNYRVITRYNASSRYAVTVALYAQALKRSAKKEKRSASAGN